MFESEALITSYSHTECEASLSFDTLLFKQELVPTVIGAWKRVGRSGGLRRVRVGRA